ncbi:DNA translocase FtsK 4TM domain-containing protein, partial [Leptospira sp. 96542]|nr:DNA translocase FtsK 4TM domain-containing protein [Leptospira sp. 96542]
SLEWSRFYSYEPHLPGHAGGVLGYWMGPLAAHWLGPTGSALLAIGVWVLAVAWVFRFSWGLVAERLGAFVQLLLDAQRARRERAQDRALGAQAAREREQEEAARAAAARFSQAPDALADEDDATQVSPTTLTASSFLTPTRPAAPRLEPQFDAPPAPPVKPSARVAKERQKTLFADMPDTKLPQVDLLDSAQGRQETVSPETLEMTSRLIEKKLG